MPDLLEETLRELRAEPGARWAAELDERVARGFAPDPAPSARRRIARDETRPPRARAARRRWLLVPAAGALTSALLVIAVVVGGGDRETASTAGGGAGGAATRVAPPASGGEAATSAGAGDAAAPRAKAVVPGMTGPAPELRGGASRPRKVERSASLSLVAAPAEVERVADGIVRVTDEAGGYVATSSVSANAEGGDGSFALRVPARRLGFALAELSKLAHVASRTQDTRDITASYDSARARLREARTERDALLRALARADTVNETASLRARLRVVGAEIAGARADARRVDRRAAFATVTVGLSADPDAASSGDDGHWTPGDALADAGRILEVAAGVALIVLAAGLPLALLTLIGVAATRRAARRGRERALDSAP